jgi:hypothetical protein
MESKSRYGFKQLSAENLLDVDPVVASMVKRNRDTGEVAPIDPKDWCQKVLSVELDPHVPNDIAAMFVMAQQATCYCYWYWPMLVLGSHELLRVAESAARAAANQNAIKAKTFHHRIAALVEAGIIVSGDEQLWQTLRRLRNSATHPEFQKIYGFPQAMQVIKTVAAAISRLRWLATEQGQSYQDLP